mmetsp:Transcript_70248/g.114088  ORF Transcript_70248/g.114088 Transcript_70248/m.114088 type:complete len:258 (-) Transcript_70248:530-1303(-)
MTSKSARGVARTSTRCLGLQVGSKNSVWLCKEKVRFRALGSTPILHTDTPNLSLTPTTPLHYTNTLNDILTPITPPSPFRLPLSSFRVGRTTTLLKMDLGKFGVVYTTMYFHCGVPNAFSHFSVQYRCLAETIPETSPSNRDGGRDVPTLGSTWEVFNWEVLKGTKGFALFHGLNTAFVGFKFVAERREFLALLFADLEAVKVDELRLLLLRLRRIRHKTLALVCDKLEAIVIDHLVFPCLLLCLCPLIKVGHVRIH